MSSSATHLHPDAAAATLSLRETVVEVRRESILDAAWTRALELPWQSVHLVDVAKDVGVSRQTLYNEFGSKDELAQLLVRRQVATFRSGMLEQLTASPDLREALRATVIWCLREADQHPMVARVRAMNRDGQSGLEFDLLALFSVRVGRVLTPIRTAMLAEIGQRWPYVDAAWAEYLLDLLLRWTISQMMRPTDLDRDRALDAIVSLVGEGLQGVTINAATNGVQR